MQISDSFTRYLTHYPAEAARLRLLAKQLQCGDGELTQRTNFVGHVTASAFIVNPGYQAGAATAAQGAWQLAAAWWACGASR